MPAPKREFDELMRLVGLTREVEVNCDQCLALVAEFAEQKLAGKSLDERLAAIEHHLSVCSECREEYEALRRALDDGNEASGF